ncbi:MAG: PilZ domain-containing protein [Myxococcales bacterium]|nr:PilZ domain-containing protein [Myxococcales bacterium]
MSEDRRTAPRVDVDLDMHLGTEPDLTPHLMQNLSIGGCFIRTRTPEPPGALVMIRFALPGDVDGATVKAVGRVAWVKRDDGGASGMGIQFVQVADDELSHIRSYITGRL